MAGFIQDYLYLVPQYLPPSIASTIWITITNILAFSKTLYGHAQPFVIRLFNQPDVASVLLFGLVFLVSLKVLGMAYRAVMFWVRLILNLVFYGAMVALVLWMYTRGLDGFQEDVAGLISYWKGEYDRFSNDIEWHQRQEAMKAGVPYESRYGSGRGRRW